MENLPESCIAAILSCLGPRDVCRLSLVSKTFALAASCDELWSKLLPKDHDTILNAADETVSGINCKRQFFDQLLQPGGIVYRQSQQVYDYSVKAQWPRLNVFLRPLPGKRNIQQRCFADRQTGRYGFALPARAMMICWIEDSRYWSWESDQEAWFSESAKLLSVCWFDVRGRMRCNLPPGTYRAFWRLKLTSDRWAPVQCEVSVRSTGQRLETEIDFREAATHSVGIWTEHSVGTFTVTATNGEEELEFALHELDGWKSGISVDCFVISPCNAE